MWQIFHFTYLHYHKLWLYLLKATNCGIIEVVMENSFVYVKGRLDADLHKELKVIAQEDKRSMVYLLNEAVKLLIEKHKSAKA